MANETLIARASAAIQAAQTAAAQSDYAELEAIADEAASKSARTPAEALLQAAILVGEIDRQGPHARIAQLAEALVDFLERSAGIDRREFGFEYYTGAPLAA